jgi:hypothetical protein
MQHSPNKNPLQVTSPASFDCQINIFMRANKIFTANKVDTKYTPFRLPDQLDLPVYLVQPIPCQESVVK